MNITGIGPRSPAPAGSGRAFNAAYQAASQRLLKAQADHESVGGDGGGGGDKSRRLVASRSHEEKAARQRLQRRLELGRILHSSVNDDFMRTVFAGRRVLAERVPRFLKKIVSDKQTSFVNDEDCQEDILDNDFIREALLWHNIYRRHHNTPPLKISAQLCGKAQAWANHLAHTNTFLYENDKSVGQNIFCRLSQDAQTDTSGNFTQLVWKNTKYFGIGRARSRAGKLLIVANYQPPGNITGLFQENVLPPLANRDFP